MKKDTNKQEEQVYGSKRTFWDHYFSMWSLTESGSPLIHKQAKKFLDEKDILLRHYSLANIPEKYFNFNLEQIKRGWKDEVENLQSIDIIEKYFNSLDSALKKGIGLYIYGPHGVAKTTIATIILKKAIQLRYRCFFNKSSEIIEFARSGWKNEEKAAFYDYLTDGNIDFLVIDDIARLLDVVDNERIFIDKIFTKRDDLNLPTIITSNKELEELEESFGTALNSNFKERLILVKLIGDDFRKKIGTNLINEL